MKSKASTVFLVITAGSALVLSGCLRQPGPNDAAPRISNAPPAQPTGNAAATSTATTTTIASANASASSGMSSDQGANSGQLAAFPIGTTANLPVGFPLPKYPGARVITSQQVPRQQQLAMLVTADPTPKVAQYYRSALAQQGWSMQNGRSNIRAVPGTEVLTASKPGLQAVVSINRNETLTRIDIVITSLRH